MVDKEGYINLPHGRGLGVVEINKRCDRRFRRYFIANQFQVAGVAPTRN